MIVVTERVVVSCPAAILLPSGDSSLRPIWESCSPRMWNQWRCQRWAWDLASHILSPKDLSLEWRDGKRNMQNEKVETGIGKQ